MYLKDIHIAYYILFILIGAIIGQFTDWIIKRAPEEKKIFLLNIKIGLDLIIY